MRCKGHKCVAVPSNLANLNSKDQVNPKFTNATSNQSKNQPTKKSSEKSTNKSTSVNKQAQKSSKTNTASSVSQTSQSKSAVVKKWEVQKYAKV